MMTILGAVWSLASADDFALPKLIWHGLGDAWNGLQAAAPGLNSIS